VAKGGDGCNRKRPGSTLKKDGWFEGCQTFFIQPVEQNTPGNYDNRHKQSPSHFDKGIFSLAFQRYDSSIKVNPEPRPFRSAGVSGMLQSVSSGFKARNVAYFCRMSAHALQRETAFFSFQGAGNRGKNTGCFPPLPAS
jgi:hypothetical protein